MILEFSCQTVAQIFHRLLSDVFVLYLYFCVCFRKMPEKLRTRCGFFGDHGFDNKITSMRVLWLLQTLWTFNIQRETPHHHRQIASDVSRLFKNFRCNTDVLDEDYMFNVFISSFLHADHIYGSRTELQVPEKSARVWKYRIIQRHVWWEHDS